MTRLVDLTQPWGDRMPTWPQFASIEPDPHRYVVPLLVGTVTIADCPGSVLIEYRRTDGRAGQAR